MPGTLKYVCPAYASPSFCDTVTTSFQEIQGLALSQQVKLLAVEG